MTNAEYMRKYRALNPEYCLKERIRDKEYSNNKYKNDEEFRERKKQYNLQRYHKLKEMKQNNAIVAN